ncbi:MAG: amino acid permease [Bacteroidia bacterium]|nr:amino acid permease [Bacteroidia bacterium]
MEKKFSLYTGVSLVVANMVGTGIFTSLGFQVMGITSGFAIIMLWVLGGIIALLGAFAYSELGAMMPRSGGEYTFLTKIFHPSIGFLAGWISFLIGFAAPVAAAAYAFGRYLCSSIDCSLYAPKFLSCIEPPALVAILVIVFFTVLHSTDKFLGAKFQNVLTTGKVIFILTLIVLGFVYGTPTGIDFLPSKKALHDMISPAFAISMYFVTYSYSGWNAAAYISGEIKNPSRNIPFSLIIGTAFVIFLYVMVNFIFLYTVPIPDMAGQLEVGYVYAGKVFGIGLGRIMGGIISILLLSTISSMIIIGPRISQVIGDDFSLFRRLSKKSKKDIPYIAIITQSAISILYILTSTFEQVIVFIGFSLNLFCFLTVLGLIVHRIKQPNLERPYKTPFYPFLPLLFLLINIWILVYGFIYKPHESLAGVAFTIIGLIVYFISRNVIPKTR